jgi:hypothetical protein
MENKKICRHCKINNGDFVDSVSVRNGKKYRYYSCRTCQSLNSRNYRKTESGKKVYYEMMKRQYKKNRHKIIARAMVSYYVKKGFLTKQEVCEICKQKTKTQAHHKDYSKPLEVNWLCRECHNKTTKLIKNTSN